MPMKIKMPGKSSVTGWVALAEKRRLEIERLLTALQASESLKRGYLDEVITLRSEIQRLGGEQQRIKKRPLTEEEQKLLSEPMIKNARR